MGKNLIFLPSCHSTNQEVSDRVKQSSMPDGTLVITENQTDGRGQRDNRWFSEPGKNLTFSLLFYPRAISAKDHFALNMALSLGITDALAQILPEVKIKWPNDIYIHEKKLAGLLIQNTIKGQFISQSIVGVGLNVNQQAFSLPQAVSLNMISGEQFDLSTILEEVCYGIEVRYLALMRGKELKAAYMERLYLHGVEHEFRARDRDFRGTITEVQPSGVIVIETDEGPLNFQFKEVQFT